MRSSICFIEQEPTNGKLPDKADAALLLERSLETAPRSLIHYVCLLLSREKLFENLGDVLCLRGCIELLAPSSITAMESPALSILEQNRSKWTRSAGSSLLGIGHYC